jgi:hypothetical protein
LKFLCFAPLISNYTPRPINFDYEFRIPCIFPDFAEPAHQTLSSYQLEVFIERRQLYQVMNVAQADCRQRLF